MDPILAAVRAGASTIVNGLTGFDFAFGVGNYKDFPNDPYAFNPQQSVTKVTADVQAAINGWSSSGGFDIAEGQFFALDKLAEPPGGPIGWRAELQAHHRLVRRRPRPRSCVQGNFWHKRRYNGRERDQQACRRENRRHRHQYHDRYPWRAGRRPGSAFHRLQRGVRRARGSRRPGNAHRQRDRGHTCQRHQFNNDRQDHHRSGEGGVGAHQQRLARARSCDRPIRCLHHPGRRLRAATSRQGSRSAVQGRFFVKRSRLCELGIGYSKAAWMWSPMALLSGANRPE